MFDLLVIGGGSGGSACARRAAGYGAKVCLVERGPTRDANGVRTGGGPGGTCVNVGCVPKKVMFEVSRQREGLVGGFATAQAYSLSTPAGTGDFDWAGHKKERDAYVARLNKKYTGNWAKEGIELVEGVASFVNQSTVSVQLADGSQREISAHKILIACGGVPALPEIPGAELAITSDGFFDLEQRPQKVAVVGAGYIAVELAGIFHGLGSETHLLFRGESVLRHGFDSFVTGHLMKLMERDGPCLHPQSTPTRLFRAADGTITLVASGPNGHESEVTGLHCVLMATGRKPYTAPLELEKAGVATDARSGRIIVDDNEQTSVPNVFAIGDATTSPFDLTPVAIAAGRRLADRLYGNEPDARLEYHDVATVIFSHPPIGTIGLTEMQAVERYGRDAIRVKSTEFAGEHMALLRKEKKVTTAFKLVLCGAEEKVVGLHCIGQRCDEMMQGFAVAMKMGATRADFEAAVAIHPTEAEEFVTFGGWGQMPRPHGQPAAPLKPMLPPSVTKARTAAAKARQGRAQLALAFVVGVAITMVVMRRH